MSGYLRLGHVKSGELWLYQVCSGQFGLGPVILVYVS
jgi:hypothetical protein